MNIITQKLEINIPQIYKIAEEQYKHLRFNKIPFNYYTFDYRNEMIANSSFHCNKALFEKFIYLVNFHIKENFY